MIVHVLIDHSDKIMMNLFGRKRKILSVEILRIHTIIKKMILKHLSIKIIEHNDSVERERCLSV